MVTYLVNSPRESSLGTTRTPQRLGRAEPRSGLENESKRFSPPHLLIVVFAGFGLGHLGSDGSQDDRCSPLHDFQALLK